MFCNKEFSEEKKQHDVTMFFSLVSLRSCIDSERPSDNLRHQVYNTKVCMMMMVKKRTKYFFHISLNNKAKERTSLRKQHHSCGGKKTHVHQPSLEAIKESVF
jgi:hypothetical protein